MGRGKDAETVLQKGGNVFYKSLFKLFHFDIPYFFGHIHMLFDGIHEIGIL